MKNTAFIFHAPYQKWIRNTALRSFWTNVWARKFYSFFYCNTSRNLFSSFLRNSSLKRDLWDLQEIGKLRGMTQIFVTRREERAQLREVLLILMLIISHQKVGIFTHCTWRDAHWDWDWCKLFGSISFIYSLPSLSVGLPLLLLYSWDWKNWKNAHLNDVEILEIWA